MMIIKIFIYEFELKKGKKMLCERSEKLCGGVEVLLGVRMTFMAN